MLVPCPWQQCEEPPAAWKATGRQIRVHWPGDGGSAGEAGIQADAWIPDWGLEGVVVPSPRRPEEEQDKWGLSRWGGVVQDMRDGRFS